MTCSSPTQDTQAALAWFDSLAPVPLPFMQGPWQGQGWPTGHALDGVLEAFHWHGKVFDGPDAVHPLVFRRASGTTVRVNPVWFAPGLGLVDRVKVPQARWVGRLFQGLLPLLATRASCARLRITRYREVDTASMLYDRLPIIDVFRKIDDDTVLGVMDCKGMARPFFFVLRREDAASVGPPWAAG